MTAAGVRSDGFSGTCGRVLVSAPRDFVDSGVEGRGRYGAALNGYQEE